MGNGAVKNIGRGTQNKPYSAAGSGIEDPEEELTGTILDLQGKPINPLEPTKGAKRGTITCRYSPENLEECLIKILDCDMDTDKTLELCFMEMELFDKPTLSGYIDYVGDQFVDNISAFFKEDLQTIHLHAIACSMFDLIKKYSHFLAYTAIDDMLTEHLADEGEFNPQVIKTMTGLSPADQQCLEPAKV